MPRHAGHCFSLPGRGHRGRKAAGQPRAPDVWGGPRSWINTPSSALPLHKRGAGQPPRVLQTPAVTHSNFPQVGRTRQQHRARQLVAASGGPQPHGPRPVCFLLLQIQHWHSHGRPGPTASITGTLGVGVCPTGGRAPPAAQASCTPPHPHRLSPPRPGLGTHTPSEAAALAAPARVSPVTRQRRVRGPEVGRARMPSPYLAHSSFRRTAAGTRTHTCSTCSRTCPRSDTTSDHRSSSERHSLRTQGTRYGLRAGDVKGSCLGGTGHCPRRQPRGAKAAR